MTVAGKAGLLPVIAGERPGSSGSKPPSGRSRCTVIGELIWILSYVTLTATSGVLLGKENSQSFAVTLATYHLLLAFVGFLVISYFGPNPASNIGNAGDVRITVRLWITCIFPVAAVYSSSLMIATSPGMLHT
ncbi:hypothetical protein HDU86_007770 [Geranomyces michiganensis]|nr:hypothetical protein HDU86_007770 [Geranomyces michiganensis]